MAKNIGTQANGKTEVPVRCVALRSRKAANIYHMIISCESIYRVVLFTDVIEDHVSPGYKCETLK